MPLVTSKELLLEAQAGGSTVREHPFGDRFRIEDAMDRRKQDGAGASGEYAKRARGC